MITYTRRLHELAQESPDAEAVVFLDGSGRATRLTRRQLAERSARTARALAGRGAGKDALVVLALPNGVEHVMLSYAAWWLGACVLPLSPKLAPREREQVLHAAASSGRDILLLDEDGATALLVESVGLSDAPLPDEVPCPGRAIASGGSTGSPKIIVDTRPHVAVPGGPTATNLLGRGPGQTVLVLGPLYHTLSYGTLFATLFDGGRVVLLSRFDEAVALDAIERFGVEALATVPAHLQRMARVPGIEQRDLSSLVSLYHSGAVCPPWLKRRWIELVGPTHLYEGFGSTEGVGMVVIRGDEWLEHPGSVGRPVVSEVVIRDEAGNDLGAGEVGEIYLRWRAAAPYIAGVSGLPYRYWGSEPARSTDDGFVSVGDMGWVDDDGYLFVADRRVDMIITGGVNVYPAEVESVLSEHPAVADVVVVGVADPEWGRRVHAVVEPTLGAVLDPDALVDELDRHCRQQLSSVKVPKTYEVVASLPRNEIGKVRRRELAERRAVAEEVGT